MSLNSATGAFSWTPSEAQGPGVYLVKFRVTDNTGLFSELTISITINEVNQAPVLTNPGNQSVKKGKKVSFKLNATDSDLPNNTLTYSIVSGLQTGMSLSGSTFTWNVPSNQATAPYSVTFRVTDNGTPSLSNNQAITITVTP
jgi:hypothetical protein